MADARRAPNPGVTNIEKVISRDGTAIAVETVGSGPPVVVVVGAFCDRTSTRDLAALLADRFTVHAYDRRGRGDSSDSPAYTVGREFEDLAAVVEHAGGAPAVYGHSSGAIIALRAAAAGLPVSRVAAYEPPWAAVDHAVRNAATAERVGALVRAGRPDDALEDFLGAAFELPPAVVAQMKGSPAWASMVAMARTLPYECGVAGDQRVPTDLLADLALPTLLLVGGDSEEWARDAVCAAAAAIPGARQQLIPGQGHGVDHGVLAPVLAEFLATGGGSD